MSQCKFQGTELSQVAFHTVHLISLSVYHSRSGQEESRRDPPVIRQKGRTRIACIIGAVE